MNHIVEYSEDSEEDNTSLVTHSCTTNKKDEMSYKPTLSPSVGPVRAKTLLGRSQPTEGNPCSDYFNLNSSSEDDEEDNRSEGEKSKVPVEVQANMPVLSFWNDDKEIASTSDIQNDKQYGAISECRHRTTWSQYVRNLSEDTSALSSDVNRYLSKNTKYVAASAQSIENSEVSMFSFPKKPQPCYQIHDKVAPALNRDCVCFCVPKSIMTTLKGHSGAINKIQWCVPQFSHIIASASMDRKVNIWNIFDESKTCVKCYVHHTKAVTDVTWSETGKNLLTCSYDKTAFVTDVETGTNLAVCEHENFVLVGRYHPVNFHYFVTGTLDKLCCWDLRNTVRPAKTYVFKDKFGQVRDLAFSKDGNQFFTCNDHVSRDSADKNIMAWDFNKHVVVSNQIYQERYTCTRLKVHPSKDEFLAQSQGGYIAQFSTIRPYKMNKYKRFESHKVMGYNVGFDVSPDGKYIASASADGSVHFYNYNSAKKVHTTELGEKTVCLDVACHPVFNSTVAVSTWDGDIVVLK